MPREHATVARDDGQSTPRSWWEGPFAVLQTNLQEVDATLDVDSTLDFLESFGADTWLLNTGGIVSFYQTDLPFQTRNPLLEGRPSGDLVGDALHAAHDRGIRVLARVDLSKVSARIAAEHPDWLFVSSTGEPQVYNSLYSVCPSRAYYQERSFDVLDEILDRYPVDGFFINWFTFPEVDYSKVRHGVCHCPECTAQFEAHTAGLSLPAAPGDEHYDVWRGWADAVIDDLTGRIARHISARRPDVPLVLGSQAHLTYWEANSELGGEFWPYASSDDASWHRSGHPHRTMVMNCVSFADIPYRLAGVQPETFGQYLLQAISRGARPSTYVIGEPLRNPYSHLKTSAEITTFYSAHPEVYDGLEADSPLALVRSESGDQDEYRGVYSALTQAHRPFDVVPVEAIPELAEASALTRFRLLILPAVGALPEAVAATLDGLVRDGARVLLTGGSATTDAGAVQLRTAPATIRTARADGTDVWSTYATLRPQPHASRFRFEASLVPVYGVRDTMVWTPDAERIGNILSGAPFGPPEKCWGHILGGEPVAGRRSVGSGSVTLIPWTIGAAYREFGTTEVRDVLLELVDRLAPPELRTDLPEQVEVSFGRTRGRRVVHLLNHSGMRPRSFGPHLPITGAWLELPGDRSADVAFLVAGSTRRVEPHDGVLRIELPTLEQFEVITVN